MFILYLSLVSFYLCHHFVGKLGDLLISYFVKFGDKPTCGSDLKLYLPGLDSVESERFLTQTFKTINFDDSDAKVPKTVTS